MGACVRMAFSSTSTLDISEDPKLKINIRQRAPTDPSKWFRSHYTNQPARLTNVAPYYYQMDVLLYNICDKRYRGART